MKKILLMIFSCFILWNCEKESVLDPIIIVDPTLETFTITALTIGQGGVIDPQGVIKVTLSELPRTYKIVPDKGFKIKSIKFNGIEQSINEEIVLNSLKKDENFVTVEFEREDIFFLEKTGSWYLNSSRAMFKEGEWTPMIPEPAMFSDYRIFKSGYLYTYDSNNVHIGGPYGYNLEGEILKVEHLTFKVVTLNKDTLSWIGYVPFVTETDSVTIQVNDVYTHNRVSPIL